ncbi:unknown [Clostridium sp. CAG:505]|nr:unknown [Clostridium sp. CAG:505]
MLVHGRYFRIEYIQSGLNVSPQTGNGAVIVWNICVDTFLDTLSAGAACEPGYIIIFAFQFGFHEGAAFYRQCCVVYNACQFASHCSCRNRFTNSGRFFQTCGACANVTGFYIHSNFFRGFAFCLIHFLEFVHVISPFFIYLIKIRHTANKFLLMHTIYAIIFYILP